MAAYHGTDLGQCHAELHCLVLRSEVAAPADADVSHPSWVQNTIGIFRPARKLKTAQRNEGTIPARGGQGPARFCDEVTSAVFVTCVIFTLSLPPTIPFWMVIVGIVVGVVIGKMAFGGFGQNIFNPAMVGRCFLYVTFPIQLTNSWVEPMWGRLGGFLHWANPTDALVRATPLVHLKQGGTAPLGHLFIGNIPGSLGETSALLIILGGAFIIYKKAASWRLALSCLLGGTVVVGVLHGFGFPTVPNPASALLSGSFLFGSAFVATEPISGAKTKPSGKLYVLLSSSISFQKVKS